MGFLNKGDYLFKTLSQSQFTMICETEHYNNLKGELSDSFTNYNNVGNTKVSVSIKKTNANKCTLSEIFLTEILKSFSGF